MNKNSVLCSVYEITNNLHCCIMHHLCLSFRFFFCGSSSFKYRKLLFIYHLYNNNYFYYLFLNTFLLPWTNKLTQTTEQVDTLNCSNLETNLLEAQGSP